MKNENALTWMCGEIELDSIKNKREFRSNERSWGNEMIDWEGFDELRVIDNDVVTKTVNETRVEEIQGEVVSQRRSEWML